MAQNFEKPVVGYNHNVKHRGKLFHIQTEDSGVKNPHVITHVFVGGNVIATKKISYADILDAENLPDAVRQLMEMQHKEILRNLINGVYDDLEPGATLPRYQSGEIAQPRDPPLGPVRRGAESSRPASTEKPIPPRPRQRRMHPSLRSRKRVRSTRFLERT